MKEERLIILNAYVCYVCRSRVKLCVGGQMFMTSTLTLTKEPDSMLSAMFSGRHALRHDDDGIYFIDRDATHFRYILNYTCTCVMVVFGRELYRLIRASLPSCVQRLSTTSCLD